MTEIERAREIADKWVAGSVIIDGIQVPDNIVGAMRHIALNCAAAALSAQASRVAELEGALKTIRASAEQSGYWPPRRRGASLEGILKVATKALGRDG